MTFINLRPPRPEPPPPKGYRGALLRAWWRIRREVWTRREEDLRFIMRDKKGDNWMVS